MEKPTITVSVGADSAEQLLTNNQIAFVRDQNVFTFDDLDLYDKALQILIASKELAIVTG